MRLNSYRFDKGTYQVFVQLARDVPSLLLCSDSGHLPVRDPKKELAMKTTFSTLLNLSLALALFISSDLTVYAQPSPGLIPISPSSIDPERELVITDLSVIEHPILTDPSSDTPYWTFKYLMEQMSPNQNTSAFVQSWLSQWLVDQPSWFGSAPARQQMQQLVIDPWLNASGGNSLDLRIAPFKLIAIINRIDMRSFDCEDVFSAGEGRFVFAILDENGEKLGRGFYVIFEYNLKATSFFELKQWATKWHELSQYPIGSNTYIKKLAKITRRFSDAYVDFSAVPMGGPILGSHLNQLRTNEVALADPWELREFKIASDSGMLVQVPVAQTPDFEFFNGTQIGRNIMGSIINAGIELPPVIFGSAAPTPFAIPWEPNNVSTQARHLFAVNTCNGCHQVETAAPFVHIGIPLNNNLPVSLGSPAALSGFMTGIDVQDPVDPTIIRHFNDIKRRRVDFAELLFYISQGIPGPCDELAPTSRPH